MMWEMEQRHRCMELRETDEQRLPRSSVAATAARYGHDYLMEKARTGAKTSELWADAAAAGYLGVAVPAEYGGGGAGMVELTIVAERSRRRAVRCC